MRTAMRIGSWLSILTGTLHLLAHFKGLEPTRDAERTMLDMMARLRFDAGGVERTMMDIFGGLSLAFSTLLFLMGFHGLRLARSEDGTVRREAAFAYATTAAVLTGLGLLYFPTPPTVLTGLMAVAFAVAAARAGR